MVGHTALSMVMVCAANGPLRRMIRWFRSDFEREGLDRSLRGRMGDSAAAAKVQVRFRGRGHELQRRWLRIRSTSARSGILHHLPARAARAKSSVDKTRALPEGRVSSGEPCPGELSSFGCAGTSAFGIGLLKDTYNLGFQFREFHREHDSLRMKNEVASSRQ